MHQESELRTKSKQRFSLILPAMCFGVLAMFGYFGLLALVRDDVVAWANHNFGANSENWIMFPLIIPAILIFLLPTCVAERKAKRYSIPCPSCNNDLTLSVPRVLKTRCCSNCGKRVVENGKMRSNETYSRYCQRQWRNYLVYWFWTWPVCGVTILIWHRFGSSSFENCQHMIFVFGLLGTIASGWALIRTYDYRYLPQTIASMIVLALGIFTFIQ